MNQTVAGMAIAAGLLLTPCFAEAQTVAAQTSPRGHSANVATTSVGEFLDKPDEEQTNIVINKLFTLMDNLGALRDSRGNRKLPEMVRAHQQMFDIIKEHFFSEEEKIFDDGLTAFGRLWLDFEFASPEASFDQVFMNHIRKVIADYERARNEVSRPAGG